MCKWIEVTTYLWSLLGRRYSENDLGSELRNLKNAIIDVLEATNPDFFHVLAFCGFFGVRGASEKPQG